MSHGGRGIVSPARARMTVATSPVEQLGLFADAPARQPTIVQRPQLVVLRDRGLVWERAARPHTTCWTFREFFDRVRQLAFETTVAGIRDDDVALFGAASVLSNTSAFAIRVAPELRTLYRTLAHASVDAPEIVRALVGEPGRPEELVQLFQAIQAMKERLTAAHRVDGASALAEGVKAMEGGRVPPVLRRFSSVRIEHLVDPSELELRAIIALANAGVAIQVVLPIDEGRRGLGEAVSWIADTLEAAYEAPLLDVVHEEIGGRGPLREFVDAWYAPKLMPASDAPVRIEVTTDQGEEARRIAGAVSAWWQGAKLPPRIAVVVRTLDAQADRIAHALQTYGIPVRRRVGPPLSESTPARLLQDLFRIRREGAPRDLVLGVLASPSFHARLIPEQVGALSQLLRRAVARTDVEDSTRPMGGFAHRLERFAAAHDGGRPALAKEARDAIPVVAHVLEVANALPERARLPAYIEIVVKLVTHYFVDDEQGHRQLLQERLRQFQNAVEHVAHPRDPAVDLAAFGRLLMRALAESRLPAPACDIDRAVELMPLPEVMGRQFDHVVIADCTHGRLPLAERLDPLMTDGDRRLVNQRLGRKVFRLFSPDLLEPGPVPRRHALELIWFAGAVSAASASLLLTAAARDARGREQATSIFLQKALVAVGASPEDVVAGIPLGDAPSRRMARISAAQSVARARPSGCAAVLSEQDRLDAIRFAQMTEQRRNFFSRTENTAPYEVAGPYAFAVNPERFNSRFGRQLGMTPEKPLGPTRLEAIASCRMRGFVEHLLGVDTWPFPDQDGDARSLGQLAHRVLEIFYRERRDEGVLPARLNRADRDRLLAILQESAVEFIERVAPGHQGALRANVDWLGRTLLRTVSMLARDPPVAGTAPRYFELKLGTRGFENTAEALGPVPISVLGRDLWFGGEIDRVDEGPDARVIVDYKNSTAAAVIDKVHERTLLKTHFQLPLYLRLLEFHRPTPPSTRLVAYLVSLRDGTPSRVLGERTSLRRLVVDDQAEDGLAAGIGRVLSPYLQGVVVPDVGERCKSCRLARVCRTPASNSISFDAPYQPPVEGNHVEILSAILAKVKTADGED